MTYFYAALIGLVGGVSSGLFGVGGGVVMVPAMVLLLGVPMHTAVGTSLLVIIPTALSGTYKHYLQQNVQVGLALMLTPTAMLGGWLGARLAEELSAVQLKRAFGGFLVVVGLRLLIWK